MCASLSKLCRCAYIFVRVHMHLYYTRVCTLVRMHDLCVSEYACMYVRACIHICICTVCYTEWHIMVEDNSTNAYLIVLFMPSSISCNSIKSRVPLKFVQTALFLK